MPLNTFVRALVLALTPGIFIAAPKAAAAASGQPMETRLAQVLSEKGLPGAGAVRKVTLSGGRLTVEFAPSAAEGLTDSGLEAMTDAVRQAFHDGDGIYRYSLQTEGRSLASRLPPVPVVPQKAQAAPPVEYGPNTGPLAGRKIVLSPGHGWTYYGTNPYWHLQRSYWFGIVEDFVNNEIIQNVYNLLVSSGATVYTTREMDKSYGDCNTSYSFAGLGRPAPNKPWWQMAALYYTCLLYTSRCV